MVPTLMTLEPNDHSPSWRPESPRPKPGLYLVATPIGQIGDLSPRAAWLLAQADLICVEDSRKTAALLHALGIQRPAGTMVSVHAHNEARLSDGLVERGLQGASLVLVTDAGTPAISDPGARLVARAWAAGLLVSPVPGPSALTAALSVCGFWQDDDRPVSFWGFLPARRPARLARLKEMDAVGGIGVAFEAPHRIEDCLVDLETAWGRDRLIMLGRELTKPFETLLRGTLGEIQAQRRLRLAQDPGSSQGEYVLVMSSRLALTTSADDQEIDRWAGLLGPEMPKPAAARLLAKAFGLSRDQAYDRLMQLEGQAARPSGASETSE